MPARAIVSKELADLLGVLSHPDRIRLVEELRAGELDVNSLQEKLGLSHSRVSQHLSVLRAHRLVAERREGRHVHYHLVQPELASWLLEGLRFIEGTLAVGAEMQAAVERTRSLWSTRE